MTTRQINLLPSDIAERRRARQITLMLAAGGLVLIAILALVYGVQAARLSGERGKLADQERSNARVEGQIRALQDFANDQAELRTKQQLLTQLTANEVRWSLILNNISLAIPSEVWLTDFSGSVQAPTASPGGVTTGPVGTVQVAGKTFTHLDVARWLTQLSRIDEFLFPYLSLSQKSTTEAETLVDFNSSLQLSDKALRRNQPGGARLL